MTHLQEFYTLLDESAALRRDLVDFHLIEVAKPTRLEGLKRIYERIRDAINDDGTLTLKDRTGRAVSLTPDYELSELQKDIHFFEKGESSFQEELNRLHPRFGEELKELTDFLGNQEYDEFVTDRDGTVNNYCGRYRSSVQSGYNAVYLSRFARRIKQKPIILTSAPLEERGITELTVIPENLYILAGSKGREYRDIYGERRTYPLSEEEARILNRLNDEITALLEKPENQVFSQIGSSFQRKFGETTIAHQDIHGSVPKEESDRFVAEVKAVVERLSGGADRLTIDDTGKDLEISLSSGTMGKEFDKGDGVAFLFDALAIEAEGRRLLICGDTESDVSMVRKGMELGASVTAVFVTDNEELRRDVWETGARTQFVSSPDVLVAGLNHLAQQGE